jgi:hypothetical protein
MHEEFIVLLNHNENKILRDLSQMESSHSNQIIAFNEIKYMPQNSEYILL